jgi:hypothetical protein
MAIRRKDQARVLTDDGTVWDYMSELVLPDPEDEDQGMEPIEISRTSGFETTAIKWMRRRKQPIALLVVTLDAWGQESTPIYALRGRLEDVRLSEYDANSSDASLDHLVILPTKVLEL